MFNSRHWSGYVGNVRELKLPVAIEAREFTMGGLIRAM